MGSPADNMSASDPSDPGTGACASLRSPSPARLILVGGFLGAGKTTLLAEAAKRLDRQGLRVGLITNDQADGLVDTELLDQQELAVREVAGGCFCCRFSCLLSASDLLVAEEDTDVLLAEPVGSCTDLSATVLQPLKAHFGGRFALSPFSVLVDPHRLREVLGLGEAPALPEQVVYILRKQLEEADLIVLNKVDLLSADGLAELEEKVAREFPHAPLLEMSALTGEGVDAWLDVVTSEGAAGERIAEVDYDVYAAGEAELGWLNAAVSLRASGPADWRAWCAEFLGEVREAFAARSAQVGHVKVLLSAGEDWLVGNLVRTGAEPAVQGTLDGAPAEARLTVNARGHLDPDALREVVEASLSNAGAGRVSAEIERLDCFSPARPTPEHRFDAVAASRQGGGKTGRRVRMGATAGLLAFVVASVGFFLWQEVHGGGPAAGQGPLADGVTVYFFHPVARCTSCWTLEKWFRRVRDARAGRVDRGRQVAWREVAYDHPAGAGIAARYGVHTAAVVIESRRGGKSVRASKLDDILNLAGDEAAFRRRVLEALDAHLGDE